MAVIGDEDGNEGVPVSSASEKLTPIQKVQAKVELLSKDLRGQASEI